MGRWTWSLVGVLAWASLLCASSGCRHKEAPESIPAAEAEAPGNEENDPGSPAPPAATPHSADPGTGGGAPTEEPPVAPAPEPPPAPQVARPPLPDPRILLTQKDVEALLGTKTRFVRSALPGIPSEEDRDAILYLPEKGSSFGAAVQVFRGRSPDEARDRYVSLLASYPSAQEIQPVAGRTFFSYWDEVIHVGFLVPSKNLVVVASCGRTFCDSDGLYELTRKMAGRLGG